MDKHKLKVVIFEGVYGINAEYSNAKKSYTGMMYELWEKVKKELETKYIFEEKFINPLSYESLIDDLYNNKYDIIVGDFSASFKRSEKVNFTNTLFISKNAILFKPHGHPFISKIIYVIKNIVLLPLIFLIVLGIILGNILHYVEPKRYFKSIKKQRAIRRSILTTIAALFGEMGFLFENSPLSYLGIIIVICIAVVSITVLMVLQGEIIKHMDMTYDNRFSFDNLKNTNLISQDGYLGGSAMKHYGASVKFIKNKSLDNIIEKYLIESNNFDGMVLDIAPARDYAKKNNLSVSANDIGWSRIVWIVNKNNPKLLVEIDTELSKLKQNLFIKDMCDKYFEDKTDTHLCSF